MISFQNDSNVRRLIRPVTKEFMNIDDNLMVIYLLFWDVHYNLMVIYRCFGDWYGTGKVSEMSGEFPGSNQEKVKIEVPASGLSMDPP